MHRPCKGAFTLADLIFTIVVVGTLLALLLPAVQNGKPSSGLVCQNNLRQLTVAVQMSESIAGTFPGYVNGYGETDGGRARGSWLVSILPYIEQQELWEHWDKGDAALVGIELFVCPSDEDHVPAVPKLSYVANAGYLGNAAGVENRANGIFFDATRKTRDCAGPTDERDQLGSPPVPMRSTDVRDGLSRTLLLSENIRALYWGYASEQDQTKTLDRKYHFGFVWDQPTVVLDARDSGQVGYHRMVCNPNPTEHKNLADLTIHDGFPSSSHPEAVVVAFAGGSVRYLNVNIDPLVYAQLMTSNHKKSDLADQNGKSDWVIKQPTDSDY